MPSSAAARSAEQTFFEDPALDRAVAMVMTLAAELHVAKDRLRALEVLLRDKGLIEDGALEAYRPDEQERARLAAERQAFVASLLDCMRGEQVSQGAPADLVERFGDR